MDQSDQIQEILFNYLKQKLSIYKLDNLLIVLPSKSDDKSTLNFNKYFNGKFDYKISNGYWYEDSAIETFISLINYLKQMNYKISIILIPFHRISVKIPIYFVPPTP